MMKIYQETLTKKVFSDHTAPLHPTHDIYSEQEKLIKKLKAEVEERDEQWKVLLFDLCQAI